MLRIGEDSPGRALMRGGTIPAEPVTVNDLMSVAGNSVGMISIHDYDEHLRLREVFDNLDCVWGHSTEFQPLELVMTDDARKYASEKAYSGPIADKSGFSDEWVKLYLFYSASSNCPSCMDFGDKLTPVPPDMFALAIFIRPPGKTGSESKRGA